MGSPMICNNNAHVFLDDVAADTITTAQFPNNTFCLCHVGAVNIYNDIAMATATFGANPTLQVTDEMAAGADAKVAHLPHFM